MGRGDLIIHIRLALLSLDRSAYVKLTNTPTGQLRQMLRDLRKEQRKVGDILKQGI